MKGRDCGGVDQKVNVVNEVDAGGDHQLRKRSRENPYVVKWDKRDCNYAIQAVADEQKNDHREYGAPECNRTVKTLRYLTIG